MSLDRAWALAVLGRCRGLELADEATSKAPSRASSERSPSTPESPIPSSTPAPCSRSARPSDAPRKAASPAPRSKTRSHASSDSASRCGPSRHAPSSHASAVARAPTDLTEARERRIAALVGEGHTNREVAVLLFLYRAVRRDGLTRIYRKLEVRSRAELAHRLRAKS